MVSHLILKEVNDGESKNKEAIYEYEMYTMRKEREILLRALKG